MVEGAFGDDLWWKYVPHLSVALLELTDTCSPAQLTPSCLPLNPNGTKSMSRVAERKIRLWLVSLSLVERKEESFHSWTHPNWQPWMEAEQEVGMNHIRLADILPSFPLCLQLQPPGCSLLPRYSESRKSDITKVKQILEHVACFLGNCFNNRVGIKWCCSSIFWRSAV